MENKQELIVYSGNKRASFPSRGDRQPGNKGFRALEGGTLRTLFTTQQAGSPVSGPQSVTDGWDIASAHVPRVGEHLIVYLDHVGRLEGNIESTSKSGFVMSIFGSDRKREKLAERIEWLKENHHFSTHADRRHDRIQPTNKNSMIRLDDGRTYPVEIIDISLSGAAFSAPVQPAIGTSISLAGMQGKVVRLFDDGIAIEFAKDNSSHAFTNRLQAPASEA